MLAFAITQGHFSAEAAWRGAGIRQVESSRSTEHLLLTLLWGGRALQTLLSVLSRLKGAVGKLRELIGKQHRHNRNDTLHQAGDDGHVC